MMTSGLPSSRRVATHGGGDGGGRDGGGGKGDGGGVKSDGGGESGYKVIELTPGAAERA